MKKGSDIRETTLGLVLWRQETQVCRETGDRSQAAREKALGGIDLYKSRKGLCRAEKGQRFCVAVSPERAWR